MLQINYITDAPHQNAVLIGEKGERIPFYLYYLSRQMGWFYDISYGNFTLKGCRLAVSPNIFYQWRNVLPFGICCLSNDGLDPFYLNDFITGRIKLYLLNQDEEIIFNAIT